MAGFGHFSDGLEHSVSCRLGDGRGARGDVQLVQDVRDVPVDRMLAKIERGRSLFVTQPLSYEAKDLQFPARQGGPSGLACGVLG
jgi:hypothetical protein